MEQYKSLLKRAVITHEAKVADKFPPSKKDSVRSPSPPTDISDNHKTNLHAYSDFRSSDESDVRRHGTCRFE